MESVYVDILRGGAEMEEEEEGNREDNEEVDREGRAREEGEGEGEARRGAGQNTGLRTSRASRGDVYRRLLRI
jgi:hypothetical protein